MMPLPVIDSLFLQLTGVLLIRVFILRQRKGSLKIRLSTLLQRMSTLLPHMLIHISVKQILLRLGLPCVQNVENLFMVHWFENRELIVLLLIYQ